jgi:hypothetical protein
MFPTPLPFFVPLLEWFGLVESLPFKNQPGRPPLRLQQACPFGLELLP